MTLPRPILVAAALSSACALFPSLPPPPDADGDGIADTSDLCLRAPGTREFSGCADAETFDDERTLRLLQAGELERTRDALEQRRADEARAREEQAEAEARWKAEQAAWEEAARRSEAASKQRAEEEARRLAEQRAADEAALAAAKTDEERERVQAALAEREARERAQREQAMALEYAKTEEMKERIRAQLEAAQQAKTKSAGDDAVKSDPCKDPLNPEPCRRWVDPGDPLGGLDEPPPSPPSDVNPNAGKPGYDANGNPISASAPSPPNEGKDKNEIDFGDDTIDGNLVRPDGEFVEARRSSRSDNPGTVTRFSYPTVDAPPFTKPKQAFDLRVTLTDLLRSTATRVEEGATDAQGRLAMELPAESKSWSIDVEVSAPGFQVLGEAVGTLVLQPTGDSSTAKFRLQPLELGTPAPERRVFVSLWFEGNFLARVSRTIAVRETPPPAVTPPAVTPPVPAVARPQPVATPEQRRVAAPEQRKVAAEDTGTAGAAPSMARAAPVDDDAPGLDFGDQDTGGAALDDAGPAGPAEPKVDLRRTLGRKPSEPLIDRRRRAPDLTIHLVADEAVPGRWSVYLANAHGYVHTRADVTPPADFEPWLLAEFQRFSSTLSRGARRRDTAPPATAIAELKGFGRRLWATHVPRAVQAAFWKLHDELGEGFRTVQVYTNVPSIPWELARPWRRKADGSVEELEFLGIGYRVARWHVGRDDAEQLPRPLQEQPLEAVTAVVPRYDDAEDLPAVKAEVDAIKETEHATIVGGTRAELVKTLESAPRGIVHFAGHGVALDQQGAAPSWAVKLEKGETLQVREWRGLTPLQSQPRLFFVNACELGQSERVAGFVDGWAPALLDTGASAYIGGLWPLGDAGASEFARRFYAEVAEAERYGEPVVVADVLSRARKALYEKDDATFLGYVFYGDANLVLQP